jgi:hypothetical protein
VGAELPQGRDDPGVSATSINRSRQTPGKKFMKWLKNIRVSSLQSSEKTAAALALRG